MWNYAGDRIWTEVNYNLTWEFLNYWGAGFRLAYNPPHDDDRLTRGGPIARTPRRFGGIVNFHSDSRRVAVGRFNYQWAKDDAGGRNNSIRFNLTASPSEALEIRLGPALNWRHELAQYITSVDDPLATETYGRRYIFGGLDQTTVSIDARVNMTFTPNLSFQLYAEPFISTGDYRGLKEFEQPGTFSFLEYGTDIGHCFTWTGGRLHHRSGWRWTGSALRLVRPGFQLPQPFRECCAAVGMEARVDTVLCLAAETHQFSHWAWSQ